MRRVDANEDTAGIKLASATLCLELDCNTVFDRSAAESCPTCGSTASYPLAAWLNRGREATEPAFVRLTAA